MLPPTSRTKSKPTPAWCRLAGVWREGRLSGERNERPPGCVLPPSSVRLVHLPPLSSARLSLVAAVRHAWCSVAGVWAFSFPSCHELHYLQMCSEKLAKAYYRVPPRGHAAFIRFLTDLPVNPGAVTQLGFANLAGLTRWEGSVRLIVGAIEDLAAPAGTMRSERVNPRPLPLSIW